MRDSLPGHRRLFPQALPGLLIAAALALLLASDLWGAVFSPEPYRFGSEAMIAQGGAKYASASAYLFSGSLPLLLTLASMGFLWRGALIGHGRLLGIGYLLLLAWPTAAALL